MDSKEGIPIKNTKYISIVIPFRSMKNVSSELDTEDYIKALSHPDGPYLGFMMAIHVNSKYPQWHNIRYDEVCEDNIAIFTKKGWKKILFKDMHEQLNREMLECVEYFKQNEKEIFKNVYTY